MRRSWPEEIIGMLRRGDGLLGQGKKVTEVVKALGVTEARLPLALGAGLTRLAGGAVRGQVRRS